MGHSRGNGERKSTSNWGPSAQLRAPVCQIPDICPYMPNIGHLGGPSGRKLSGQAARSGRTSSAARPVTDTDRVRHIVNTNVSRYFRSSSPEREPAPSSTDSVSTSQNPVLAARMGHPGVPGTSKMLLLVVLMSHYGNLQTSGVTPLTPYARTRCVAVCRRKAQRYTHPSEPPRLQGCAEAH